MGSKKRFRADKYRNTADSKYGSRLVGRFINGVMLKGKKSIAEKIIYRMLDILGERLQVDPLEAFQTAIDNVKPKVEIKSRRIGGDTYQIPISVEGRRSETLAFRWILTASRSKSGKGFAEILASELMDAYNQTGTAMERRQSTHRMAEANKAFAHFA